jgi:hypothetical protein
MLPVHFQPALLSLCPLGTKKNTLGVLVCHWRKQHYGGVISHKNSCRKTTVFTKGNTVLANPVSGTGVHRSSEDPLWGPRFSPSERRPKGLTTNQRLSIAWYFLSPNWIAWQSCYLATIRAVIKETLGFIHIPSGFSIAAKKGKSFEEHSARFPAFVVCLSESLRPVPNCS